MQNILLLFLGFFARLIIQRHKPFVIGVTGTVGKTTITTHIARFLVHQFWAKQVGYSPYHYNGEYWLPLTIIGVKSPWKNPFLWLWVFFIACTRLFSSYPRYLVLEYGIDHPGEMDFLISIVKPDIAILTPVESNHLEQFGNLATYRNSKLQLILAAQHKVVHESLRQYIDIDVLYYSLGALSDIDASWIEIGIHGTRAIVHYNNKNYPILLPAIGAFQIENILPLYPVASILDINPELLSEYTLHFMPESGRSNIISWSYNSTIVDWSYNGGYLSLHEGVISMKSFLHSHRIIFFLGDMRELWLVSKEIHEKLANEILDNIPHDARVEFYLVWPLMQEYVYPILSKKFTVYSHLSSQKSGEKIAKSLKKNQIDTIIYVKWSQNTIFLEEGIKFFLQEKDDSKKLCRQSHTWMLKKGAFLKNLEK